MTTPNNISQKRAEINLERLLVRCEDMVSKSDKVDWRLEKYIESLCDYIIQCANYTPAEILFDYSRRVNMLGAKRKKPSDRDLLLKHKTVDAGPAKNFISSNADIMKHYTETNEQLAEEIIQSVHHLKENAKLSSQVIRQDIHKLSGECIAMVERNRNNLQLTTDTLAHRQSGGHAIAILVFIIFIWMIFIIRLCPV